MWTSRNRCRYERKGLRYPTDLTDAEWALVAPHIRAAKRGGRPRTTNMREVTNAILYLLGTGCQWRALPKDFPPRTTVFEYLDLWEWDGTLGRLPPCTLPRHARASGQGSQPDGRDHRQPKRQGRRKRGAQIDPSGYSAGKKVKGRSDISWSTRWASR